jgi:uncharacterized membrane protein
MNDWEIKRFIATVLAVQLVFVGLVCAEAFGLKVPVARQVVGFVYLTFIPGYLILRILKVHNLGDIESLLYAVGLSLSSLMLLGLIANTVYPIFGISRPMSLWPLAVTIIAFVSILCVLSYIRGRDFIGTCTIGLDDLLSPPVLSLCLLPFMAIFGAYLVNFHQNNVLLMILIPLIGALPLLAIRDTSRERLYPLAIFVIAVSLLYHQSLISNHVWGWDIQLEYYFSKLVLANGYWDPSLYGAINGMPAIVMLAPTYSIVSDLDVVWVFKTIYPVLFSFVPLAMYSIFRRQTNEKIAFLSCCFFMFVAIFYSTMLQLARQQIAELFLALTLMLVVSEGLRKSYKSALLIIFGISMVMSHYGTAYLFMFILIANCLLAFLVGVTQPHLKMLQKLRLRESSCPQYKRVLSVAFAMTFAVVTLAWYMYVAGSHPFETLVHSAQIIFTEFVNPLQSDAFHLFLKETASPLHDVTKIMHYISQFFVALGLVDLMFMRKHTNKFDEEYSLLSTVFFGVWVISLVIPYYGFDFTRVYHITLIALSPYFVIGGMVFMETFRRCFKRTKRTREVEVMKILSTFLLAFLLFNSGWVYEMAKDNPSSIALSNIDYPCFSEKEVIGASWLHTVKTEGGIYADSYRWLLLIGFEGYPYYWFKHYNTNSTTTLYVFLGDFNVRNGVVLEEYEIRPRVFLRVYLEATNVIKDACKIYDNGGANVYLNLRH